MTHTVQNVGRIRVDEEANGSFCVEATLNDMVDVPFVEGTGKAMMERPFETPHLAQQHIDGYPVKVPLARRARADISINMRGTNTRGTAGHGILVAADVAPAGHLLYKVGMGGVEFGTGTTIATTSSVTVLNVTSASGLKEGGAVALPTGPGGALECREIKQIATNAVTLKLALSSIPANGTIVYGCVTYYLDNLDGSTVTSLQALVEGLNSLDRWLLKGGQYAGAPKINMAPGSIPTADFSWMFADHKRADGSETSMNPSSTALSDQNYASTSINAIIDSEFRIRTHGDTTLAGTFIDASEITITPNIAYEPHTTPGGVNNIKQWVRSRVDGPPVTGEFALPYESVAWRTARDAFTAFAATYQVGSSVANGGFMVAVPHAIVDDFQREPLGGLAGQRVRWYARLDNQTNANSTALQKSAFRIHKF